MTASTTVWLEEYKQSLEDLGDPREAADRLRRYLHEREENERPELLARAFEILLQERFAYGVALLLLESVSDPDYIEEIARTMAPLPRLQSDDEEAHLADILRLLAASGRRHALRVVEAYLLDRPLADAWPTVPWALWPRHEVLFRRAWHRWLDERGIDGLDDPRDLEPFLTEPLAVAQVRDALLPARRERWNTFADALRARARCTRWLTPEQRRALNDVLS